jgi:hypothetical protein
MVLTNTVVSNRANSVQFVDWKLFDGTLSVLLKGNALYASDLKYGLTLSDSASYNNYSVPSHSEQYLCRDNQI